MNADFALAIVGSGFSASLLGMIARRLGLSVILLEKHGHPRFAIGESSTPLANLLLEELALRYDLPQLLPLTQWGSWQAAYPQIGCGLKRGFTFYHHALDTPWRDDARHERQLLVAASPHDAVADTHWYRPDFDHFLLRQAQALGVEYLDRVHLTECQPGPGSIKLRGARGAATVQITAQAVVDASGPRGFLHRALGLSEERLEHMPQTEAVFAHFRGAGSIADWASRYDSESPPYPVDAAAVHHVFSGGWIWVLQFNNGLASAGAAITRTFAAALPGADPEEKWRHLLRRLPAVQEQFARAQPAMPFRHLPNLSFRTARVIGPRWALMPSAAGFVDPLLSAGFPLALLGISRLASILEEALGKPAWEERLAVYARQTADDFAATERLIAALYAALDDFPLFSRLALLYFAAASFTETARRLGKPELAGDRFLLSGHPEHGPRFAACLQQMLKALSNRRRGLSQAERERLLAQIDKTIEPVDVAGLGRRDRRNWHPVDLADLFDSAGKLGAQRSDLEEMCRRCGLDAG